MLTDEDGGKAAAADGRPPAWILGTSSRQRAAELPGPRPGAARGVRRSCVGDVYEQAGITNPREQIDMAELYVPFSWHEAIWLEGHDIAEPGEGWKMIDDGDDRARRLVPDQPRRGGVLSSQPDRRVRASCASPRPPTRCAAPPASTRSTGAKVALAHGLRRQQPVLQHVGRGQQPPALRLTPARPTLLGSVPRPPRA